MALVSGMDSPANDSDSKSCTVCHSMRAAVAQERVELRRGRSGCREFPACGLQPQRSVRGQPYRKRSGL